MGASPASCHGQLRLYIAAAGRRNVSPGRTLVGYSNFERFGRERRGHKRASQVNTPLTAT